MPPPPQPPAAAAATAKQATAAIPPRPLLLVLLHLPRNTHDGKCNHHEHKHAELDSIVRKCLAGKTARTYHRITVSAAESRGLGRPGASCFGFCSDAAAFYSNSVHGLAGASVLFVGRFSGFGLSAHHVCLLRILGLSFQ